MIFFRLSLFLSFIAMAACSPYRQEDMYGLDEFVLDSYAIKEGKTAIEQMRGNAGERLSAKLLEPTPDIIAEGDLLHITLYHPKRKDLMEAVEYINQKKGYRVINGKVAVPHLPLAEVVGLSLEEAQKKMTDLFQKEIVNTSIFLSFHQRKNRWIYLAGVAGISKLPLEENMRLFDVLSQAKIPPNANLFKSYMMRDQQKIPIDFYRLLNDGDMSQNIFVRGGDKIYIAEPAAVSVMVMGEVGHPRALAAPRGVLSLKEALAQSGGILPTGKSTVFVLRGELMQPKVYALNWHKVALLRSESLLLMPGDIVYVGPKPITEWNRFINQLLPTTAGVEIIRKGVDNMGVIMK